MNKKPVRYLILIYFWLLIFEGALRRWIFPGFSDLLLLVRDPIAIGIFFLGLGFLIEEANRMWFLALFWIGLLGALGTMLFGHQDWLVTLYGVRVPLLHLPLIFILPKILTIDDFWNIRDWVFILAIPMSILLIFQFILPPDHWVNVAPGGEGTAAFLRFMGRGRPPGTFSFVTGVVSFYTIVTAFFFSSLSDSKKKMPLYGWLMPVCILVSLAFSIGSRTLIFRVLLTTFGFFIAILMTKKPRYVFTSLFMFLFLIFFSYGLAKQFPFFEESLLLTSERAERANTIESSQIGYGPLGVVIYRLHLDEVLNNLSNSSRFFGAGIGLNTTPGRKRLPEYRNLLRSEDEGAAGEESGILYTLVEYGPFLGICLLVWKLLLTKKLGFLSFESAFRRKNPHGIIFFFAAFEFFFRAILDAPNQLGFATFMIGLCWTANTVFER